MEEKMTATTHRRPVLRPWQVTALVWIGYAVVIICAALLITMLMSRPAGAADRNNVPTLEIEPFKPFDGTVHRLDWSVPYWWNPNLPANGDPTYVPPVVAVEVLPIVEPRLYVCQMPDTGKPHYGGTDPVAINHFIFEIGGGCLVRPSGVSLDPADGHQP